MNLASPRTVRELLQRYGLEAKKGLGQNFLADGNTLRRIVDSAGIEADENVLEIGAGLGTLTRELALRANRVVSVEADRGLSGLLQETLAGQGNIRLVFGDFLRIPLEELLDAEGSWKVVANLPYYITTPILFRLLEDAARFRRLVFLVQREVAQRAVAPPGNKIYGALSVSLQHLCDVKIAGLIPPTVFIPPPKVESAILILNPRVPVFARETEAIFRRLVEAAFRFRRKTLGNAWGKNGANLCDDQSFLGLQKDLGIDPGRRGETLSVRDFETVAMYLAARRSIH